MTLHDITGFCNKLETRIKNNEQKFELHLKDFDDIQEYVDSRKDWEKWVLRIVLGAMILSILALLGLQE